MPDLNERHQIQFYPFDITSPNAKFELNLLNNQFALFHVFSLFNFIQTQLTENNCSQKFYCLTATEK